MTELDNLGSRNNKIALKVSPDKTLPELVYNPFKTQPKRVMNVTQPIVTAS